jgi:pimeloyl-ACP methyl ester carboxylesterase
VVAHLPTLVRRPVEFFSNGQRIDGDLYLPGSEPGSWPALILCSGYQGLKDLQPARLARALVPRGYACLTFDYRSFGRSEGPAGRLVPQDQVEDVRAAISFLEGTPEAAPDRIGLVGWALGGGVVIAAAAGDERAGAVVAVNAIGDGTRSTRFMHDEHSWRRLLERISADRRRRAREGGSELVDAFEIVRLDTVTKEYVDAELYKDPGFGSNVSLESAEMLLRFHPETVVDRIAPRPLLLVHGADNALHSPDESEQLYRRAGEPKDMLLIEGHGHTEWMFDDHPTFLRFADAVGEFLDRSLAV